MDGSEEGGEEEEGVAKGDEYEKALHFFNWTSPPLHINPFPASVSEAKQRLLSAFPTEF